MQISPSELRRVADCFLQAAETTHESLRLLEEASGSLRGSWHAPGSAAFQSSYISLRDLMRKEEAILGSIGGELLGAADSYERIDGSM
jgi:WXG100 family type VII secretion target